MNLNAARILFLASEFPPQPGGIGNHAVNACLALHQRGHSVKVIADRRNHDCAGEDEYDCRLPVDVERIAMARTGLRQLLRLRSFGGAARMWRPDAVIASGRFPLLAWSWLNRWWPQPIAAAVLHGTEAGAEGSFLRKMVLGATRRYDCLLPVSRFTARHFGLDESDPRVRVICNGVKPKPVPECATGSIRLEGNPRLLTVGNLTERKGQHNVIRAMPAIAQRFPEVVYHIIGIPTLRDESLELAEKHGVGDRVQIHGAVSESELGSALAQADVFLMLSNATAEGDIEGFGIAILEANLAGVPAVGSRGCGIEDAISQGGSGELVDPADTEQVSNAVEKVCLERENYSSNAARWAQGFTWEKVAREYEEVIAFAIEKKAQS